MINSNELYKIIEPYFNYANVDLYHYTNNIGLIFNSGYLKLSLHIELTAKSHSELQVGSNLIIKQLRIDEELHKHEERFIDYIEKGIRVYTFSCCQDDKSNHHSKFGNYCIKLTKGFLSKQINRHAELKNPLLIGKVIYEEQYQNEIINNIFKSYKQLDKCSDNLVSLMQCLTLLIPLFKPIQDKDDKEYRIISYKIITPCGRKCFPIGIEKI